MADVLPFIPSDNNYRLRVTLGGTPYRIRVRWNSRDAAWYLDFYNDDLTVIATGIKVVLGGLRLGQTYQYLDFFKNHFFHVVDTSGSRKDAGFDDLGTRVHVIHETLEDFKGAPTG